MSVPIFLASGNRVKRVMWKGPGGSWGDLAALHKKAFYSDENREVPAELELTQRSFMLRDPEYGVAYEGFALHLVKEGSVVEIRDCVLEAEAEAAAAEARAIQASLAVGPDEYFVVDARPVAGGAGKRAPSEFSESDVSDVSGDDMSEDEGGENARGARRKKMTSGVGAGSSLSESQENDPVTEEEQKIAIEWAKRELDYRRRAFTLKQRTWELLDEPGSSRHATAFTFFMLTVIVFSTFTFCIETLPQYYQHDTNYSDKFFIMEAVCIALFTAELIARLCTTPDLKNYFYNRMNVVDVVAVAPFYLELALSNVDIPGLSVFRVVRLVRVLRLFKVSRGSLTIFADTMARSAKPLYMLVFFTVIATIILSSLVYYAERGEWNETLGMWMRAKVWYCPVFVGADEGPTVKDPLTYTLDSGVLEPCVWIEPDTYATDYPSVDYPREAMFQCPFAFEKDDSACVLTYEQSPFDSIPTSFWWCLVTMTTVGYGDIVPTQAAGQFIGGMVMIFGIIVIALPITVIGSNFATIYKSHVTDETLTSEEREQQEDADDELDDFEDDEMVLARNDDAL